MASLISENIPLQFKPSITWAYLFFLLVLSTHVWWDYATSSALEQLNEPVSAVADSMGPELEFFDGLQSLPTWQQRLLNFPGYSREEFVEEAIATWREVLTTLQKKPVFYEPQETEAARAYLLVLLAEERGWDAAMNEIKSWQDTDIPIIQYLSSIYGKQEHIAEPDHLFLSRYPENWATLRIARQSIQITGNQQLLTDINRNIQERARIQIKRTVIYTIVWWSLILIGVVVFLFSYRNFLRPSNKYQLAWPVSDALGVFIRAELLVLFLYLIDSYWYSDNAVSHLYFAWPSLWAGLIMLLLTYFFLSGPRQVSMRDIFGLSLSRVKGVKGLLLWIIVLFTIDNLGLLVINTIYDALGFSYPWAEGLSETLLWGKPVDVILEGVDSILWAPIFEELLFRGILYLGLRQKFSPIVAALFSAAIFSLLHFYSVIGFIEILWGGVVFALAFEYSRSLLPAIGAHILYNLNWFLYLLVYYRL